MDTANQYPPLPQKKRAVFHHPMGFELYDGLAMDMHAMAFAEPLLKEIDRLRAIVSHETECVAAAKAKIDRLNAELESYKRAKECRREDCHNLTEKVIPNLRAELAAAREDAERYRAWRDAQTDEAERGSGLMRQLGAEDKEMELTMSMFATQVDYWKARAEMAERTLNEVADKFGIGEQGRTAGAILANVENAARRSRCLSMIEAHHTITVLDDDGEEIEEQLLSWGEDPEQHIETYRAVVTPNAELKGRSGAAA